jgi:3-oxoacyl-[acyl-carrier protein] reductase
VDNQTVLVTGASRGIGRAIAFRLAEAGYGVAVHFARNRAAAEETARELGASCAGIYEFDFVEGANPALLWAEVSARHSVCALVNNAGVYEHLDFMVGDDDDFDASYRATFAVNFEAPLKLTRAACRTFAESGGGKIVNIASRVGLKGEAGAALYAASKASLINLGRSLAVELAPSNIQIYTVAPGWVETAMVRKDVEERLGSILESIPLGRMASPQDCAGAVAFLLSKDADYLSGICIDVNGASYFH